MGHSKQPSPELFEEEEEFGSRSRGETLLYLLRVALILSVVATVLQLVFLAWLSLSPNTVPSFAGVLTPADLSAATPTTVSTEARLVHVVADFLTALGLSVALMIAERTVTDAVSSKSSRLSAQHRKKLRVAAWILMLQELLVAAVQAALTFLLAAGTIVLHVSLPALALGIFLLAVLHTE